MSDSCCQVEPPSHHHHEGMVQRFWVSFFLTVPLVLMTMPQMFGITTFLFFDTKAYESQLTSLQFFLATFCFFYGGQPLFDEAIDGLKKKQLNMFSLLSLGIIVSYGFSVFVLFGPSSFFASLTNGHGLTHMLYFEESSMIITLSLLGQVIEMKAKEKAHSSIKGLLTLSAKVAKRLSAQDDKEEEVSIDALNVGDKVRVKPGEKIPSDGIILSGESQVDESMMTGESGAVPKKPNDLVYGSTLNLDGSFIMSITKTSKDNLLSQIIKMVNDAQKTKPPLERMADVWSGYFVTLVVIVAFLTFFAWWFFGPDPSWGFGINHMVSVLVIACPCALGLATPMSIMVAVGRGAREGLFIKNPEALEKLNIVDTLVFDKTGTLTEGKPKVSSLVTQNEFQRDEVLKLAVLLAQSSDHPLSQGIVAYGASLSFDRTKTVKHLDIQSGKGLKGIIENHTIIIGQRKFLEENGVIQKEKNTIDGAEERVKANIVVYIAIDQKMAGYFVLTDPLKKSTKESLAQLKQDGLNLIMLTGDHEETAKAIASQLGIENYKAHLMPKDKALFIKSLQEKGHKVAMAGDGINDAPALTQADVGIAMATGSDIAMEHASITLLGGDLKFIHKARSLSRFTLLNIKQNLFFAFCYNGLGISVASGLLYPLWHIVFHPMMAATAMSVSCVSLVINATRLSKVKL